MKRIVFWTIRMRMLNLTLLREYLDAIQGFNAHWTLHIGTEDGERLQRRAQNDDWFPSRLKNSVDLSQPITELKLNEVRTLIPTLQFNEKIQLQYLVAYDTQKEGCVDSWLAVEQSKQDLENWIGIR